VIIQPPPVPHGTPQEQITQLRNYLLRLVNDLNLVLETPEHRTETDTKTGG
jgi:hypothetical protein